MKGTVATFRKQREMKEAEKTLGEIYQEKYPKSYAALTRFIEENPDINGWSDEEVYQFAEFYADEQSREKVIRYVNYIKWKLDDYPAIPTEQQIIDSYDEWKSNQEGE